MTDELKEAHLALIEASGWGAIVRLAEKLVVERKRSAKLKEALRAECPCVNNFPDGECRCGIQDTIAGLGEE